MKRFKKKNILKFSGKNTIDTIISIEINNFNLIDDIGITKQYNDGDLLHYHNNLDLENVNIYEYIDNSLITNTYYYYQNINYFQDKLLYLYNNNNNNNKIPNKIEIISNIKFSDEEEYEFKESYPIIPILFFHKKLFKKENKYINKIHKKFINFIILLVKNGKLFLNFDHITKSKILKIYTEELFNLPLLYKQPKLNLINNDKIIQETVVGENIYSSGTDIDDILNLEFYKEFNRWCDSNILVNSLNYFNDIILPGKNIKKDIKYSFNIVNYKKKINTYDGILLYLKENYIKNFMNKLNLFFSVKEGGKKTFKKTRKKTKRKKKKSKKTRNKTRKIKK